MGIKIYKVRYDEKFFGDSSWCPSEVNVAVRGDATAAIARARNRVLGSKIEDENQRMLTITGFKPTGVELLAEASY